MGPKEELDSSVTIQSAIVVPSYQVKLWADWARFSLGFALFHSVSLELKAPTLASLLIKFKWLLLYNFNHRASWATLVDNTNDD